jgi:nucleoside-diphosphate-sugar epimerase
VLQIDKILGKGGETKMIYVVGPRGRLASAFQELLISKGLDFTPMQTQEAFDMPRLSPEDCVINFAGRAVKSDERNLSTPSLRKVNVELPKNLADECHKASSHFIHFTTELESLNPNQDEYTRTKAEATRYILGLAKLGLQVACISLPSIVGFVERPGYVEKQVRDALAKGSMGDSQIHFARGMLHKEDFNAITYAAFDNRWVSEKLITIDNVTHISSSIFATSLQRGNGSDSKSVIFIDQSMGKNISLENSHIKMMAMTPTDLMLRLIYQTLNFGLK